MKELIKKYRERLKQIESGSPELYKGEAQTIKDLIKTIQKVINKEEKQL